MGHPGGMHGRAQPPGSNRVLARDLTLRRVHSVKTVCARIKEDLWRLDSYSRSAVESS
jgi:hypothetical protein